MPTAQGVQQHKPVEEYVPGGQVILRTRKLSATMTLPLASMVIPLGEENEAPVPVPSENEPISLEIAPLMSTPIVTVIKSPLPASVLATPPGVTLRMRLLPVSVTNKFPLASMAKRVGLLNAE